MRADLSLHGVVKIERKTRTIKGEYETFKVTYINFIDSKGVKFQIKAFLKD